MDNLSLSKLSALLKELADSLMHNNGNGNGNCNGNCNCNCKNTKKNEIEKITPMYSSQKFTAEYPLPVVYRLQQADKRYYFTISDKSVQFYPSVTTIIQNTHPTSYGIKKLIGDKGLDGFYQFMKEKADYGTILHILITKYLTSGKSAEERSFDFDQIEYELLEFANQNKIPYQTEWVWQLKKDTASLIQFCIDYDVTPLLVETVIPCNNNGYPYAGAIDLLAEINIKQKGYWGETYKTGPHKGEPKETFKENRVTALIDFKSGKSGFFPEHATQLHMYARALQEALGITPQVLLNVAPKDWTVAPTYDVKDQTQTVNPAKIDHILQLFYLDWEAPKDITIIEGKLNGLNLSENVRTISAEEFILNKYNKNIVQQEEV